MNIAGTILFSPNSRVNDPDAVAVPGVVVALQLDDGQTHYGATTAIGVAVTTGPQGNFQFTDVPDGLNYRVIEAAGYAGTAPLGTVSWTGAPVITVTPADPAPGVIPNPPAGTNRINSLSPNTLFVSTEQTGLVFIDAPTDEIALELSTYVTTGPNLFTGADDGTVGEYPNGTPVMTSPPIAPYAVPPGYPFGYLQYNSAPYVPYDGYYSVSNTITNNNFSDTWFNLSDHTTGMENGRMFIINGSDPGQVIYAETVTGLTQETEYVFSLWVLNVDRVFGHELPRFRVVVSADEEVLFDQNLSGDLGTTLIPTWVQIGSTVNTGVHNTLTIAFYSEGGAADGNDYLIDDISLYELAPAPVTAFEKTVDAFAAPPGSVLTYSMTFTNEGPEPIEDVVLSDFVPTYTTIVPGTLVVDNIRQDDSQLENGLSLGTVAVGQTVNISFQVQIDPAAPVGAILENMANIAYTFSRGGVDYDISLDSTAATTVVLDSPCIECPPGATGPMGPAGPGGPGGGGTGNGYSYIATDDYSVVCSLEYMPLQRLVASTGVAVSGGDDTILLSPGAYHLSYRMSVSGHTSCSPHTAAVDITVNNRLYPGGRSENAVIRNLPTELTGTVIMEVPPNATYSVALQNTSNMPLYLYSLSIVIIKLL